MTAANQPKRRHTAADDEEFSDAVEESVQRAELDTILEQLRSEFKSDLQQHTDSIKTELQQHADVAAAATHVASQALEGTLTTRLGGLIKTYDATIQRQFTHLEIGIAALQAKDHELASGQQELRDAVHKLQAGLHVAELAQPTRTQALQDAFDREPDLTILRLSVNELVARTAVETVAVELLEYAALKSADAIVKGPTVGKTFTLAFTGAPGLAAKRTNQTFTAYRNDGDWRNIEIEMSTKRKARLYAGFDKSRKQAQIEVATKKLLVAVQSTHPSKAVHANGTDGLITVDWVPAIKVQVHLDAPTTLLWNGDAQTTLGLDKSNIVEEFNKSSPSASTTHWSI